jgi:hypothetical protein
MELNAQCRTTYIHTYIDVWKDWHGPWGREILCSVLWGPENRNDCADKDHQQITRPEKTGPDQTKPNQTKPNQTRPDRTVPLPCLVYFSTMKSRECFVSKRRYSYTGLHVVMPPEGRPVRNHRSGKLKPVTKAQFRLRFWNGVQNWTPLACLRQWSMERWT